MAIVAAMSTLPEDARLRPLSPVQDAATLDMVSTLEGLYADDPSIAAFIRQTVAKRLLDTFPEHALEDILHLLGSSSLEYSTNIPQQEQGSLESVESAGPTAQGGLEKQRELACESGPSEVRSAAWTRCSKSCAFPGSPSSPAKAKPSFKPMVCLQRLPDWNNNELKDALVKTGFVPGADFDLTLCGHLEHITPHEFTFAFVRFTTPSLANGFLSLLDSDRPGCAARGPWPTGCRAFLTLPEETERSYRDLLASAHYSQNGRESYSQNDPAPSELPQRPAQPADMMQRPAFTSSSATPDPATVRDFSASLAKILPFPDPASAKASAPLPVPVVHAQRTSEVSLTTLLIENLPSTHLESLHDLLARLGFAEKYDMIIVFVESNMGLINMIQAASAAAFKDVVEHIFRGNHKVTFSDHQGYDKNVQIYGGLFPASVGVRSWLKYSTASCNS